MSEIIDKDLLESAMHGTGRSGKSDLVKHLQGKRLTRQQAIKGKCYDCMGLGEQYICDSLSCPLNSYSPYRFISLK